MGLSAIPSLRIFIASMSTIITVLFVFFLKKIWSMTIVKVD